MKTSFENFKDDISVLEEDSNLWKGNLSDRWSIGSTPNGGYSMAFAAKAISNSLIHKDPLSISANYLERLDFGETLVKVYPIHVTKSTSTARAELIQQEKIRVIFTHWERFICHFLPDFAYVWYIKKILSVIFF